MNDGKGRFEAEEAQVQEGGVGGTSCGSTAIGSLQARVVMAISITPIAPHIPTTHRDTQQVPKNRVANGSCLFTQLDGLKQRGWGLTYTEGLGGG